MIGEKLIGRTLYSYEKPLAYKYFRVIGYDDLSEEYKVEIMDGYNGGVEFKALLDRDFVEVCEIQTPSSISVKELIELLTVFNPDEKVRLDLSCTESGSCELRIADNSLMACEV